jgi:hypothetical protein
MVDAGDDEDSRSNAIKNKSKPSSVLVSDIGGASKKAKKASAVAAPSALPSLTSTSVGASSPAPVTAGKGGIKPPPPPSSTMASPPTSTTDAEAAPVAAAKAPKHRKKDRSRQKNLRKDNRPDHAKPNYLSAKPRPDSSREAVLLRDEC